MINLFNYVITRAFQHAVHDTEAEALFFESPYQDQVAALPVQFAKLREELVSRPSGIIAVIEYRHLLAPKSGFEPKLFRLVAEFVIVSFDEPDLCLR